MDKCPYCGAETRPGDNFCLNCGNRLLPSTPSPQQAQSVIGDATIPASEDWVMPNQSMGGAGSESSSSNWSDGNASTVANTSPEISNAAPVATAEQATTNNIENPAHLILRADNGEILQDYPLEKNEITIGRAPTSDILLSTDKLTSRRHALIRYENGSYLLYDEHSANGTFVNGQQLEDAPQVLKDKDHIGIGEHELIFYVSQASASQAEPTNVDIESMPTMAVSAADMAGGDMTYRTREDELATAQASNAMNGDSTVSAPPSMPPVAGSPLITPPPEIFSPPPPPVMSPEAVISSPPPVSPARTFEQNAPPPVQSAPAASAGKNEAGAAVTFNRLTGLPQPPLPDVAPLMAALATLDGQVSSLQDQLNATQEAMRNHEAEIIATSNALRNGVRRVSERMDATIAEVARNREQLAWADLQQAMEDVMNNPRDIEYVTKLARKARELNKVFQMHQSVLNTLAECTSLLRSLIGEDK